MITYFQDGHTEDVPYFITDCMQFFIQDIGTSVDKYAYPNDSLKYDVDNELVKLYDAFRDVLFPDTKQYYREISKIPIWVQEAGQDSNCDLSKTIFNEFVSYMNSELINCFLYLVDCQYLIGTIQNLHIGMEYIFVNYFKSISNIDLNNSNYENGVISVMSTGTSAITSLLESYFIKAYSILDMFTKIAYEFENIETEFEKYKKTKSANILWGDKKQLSINNTDNTIFKKNEIITIIESLRNEVVHNGSWELNPKCYIEIRNGEITNRYFKFPDMEQGRLAASKSRRHFFSQGVKVNNILPLIHCEYKKLILNTAYFLNCKYGHNQCSD